jgi:hypothetical protein
MKGRLRTMRAYQLAILAGIWLVDGVPAAAEPVRFREQVAPVFERRCLGCHNDVQRDGDFSLQTAVAALSGGHVEPGDASASYLLELITPVDGVARMPQDGDPLSPDEIRSIRRWIEAGAPWPDGMALSPARVRNFDGWSYQPLRRPPVPRVRSRWVRTPIDAFVLAKLRQVGLAPGRETDRRTLIRRVTFDLTGLPPTPRQVAAFVADSRADAYERLVDRLLNSPHYGERWARHWLDVVAYADTCGYDKDKLRPNAWPYRDYVIRSFNLDKPYGRFVREQVAGDVLFPGQPAGILGLGFLAAGPWDFIGHVEVPESKVDGQVARNLDRDDMVSRTFNTFCSLTVQCARCHDHKFDPVTQQDYYGLQAIFAALDRAERPYDLSAGADSGRAVYAAATDFEPQGNFRPTRGRLRPIHVLRRGDVRRPGAEAVPGWLPLRAGDRWRLETGTTEGERRAALAHWLSDRHHPLVWRSIVNRVWHYHFGQGLVATPNDFGRMGARPTHPQLLDWLAVEFRDSGQELKPLHRQIVTSSVYRQASARDAANAAMDQGNRYLWRMPRRRLDAEEVRDAILAVSGSLNPRMGGPGFYQFVLERTEHSPHYEYHKFDPGDVATHRRSIYRFVVRSQPDPWMTTLDCADSSQSTPRRGETLTSLQALSLLNSQFNLVMARRFAERLRREAGSLPAQIERAMLLVAQRQPTAAEREELLRYGHAHGLANVCRLLFNLSEFVYVD